MTSPSESGALESVLDLERALETAQTTVVDADERLERARREADAILAKARERAARRTARTRSSLAAATEAAAAEAADQADAAAAHLRGKVSEVEARFIETALTRVLPSPTKRAT